jgi:chorismate synthase
MKGNFWGHAWGITSFGESHSKAVGVVIEDVKPGIDFPFAEINNALARRRPGRSSFSSSRQEPDELVVLSGVFEGKTTGMPICLVVYNLDSRPEDYELLKELFRPGHADFAYFKKFKIYDYRGGGRASGRETIARVAAAGLVGEVLGSIQIVLYPVRIGEISVENKDDHFLKQNSLYWPCKKTYPLVTDYLNEIKASGDSCGAIIEGVIRHVSSGLGDPVFEKLDANLAKAILSIGGVKGIEFGEGFELGCLKGSEANDPINCMKPSQRMTKAGGIYGGISSGEPITFRFVVKPTPSISISQETVDREGKPRKISMKGRFDTCLATRVIPVAEAMVKLVLADAISYQRLLESKEPNLTDMREALDKIDEDIVILLGKRKRITDRIKELKKKEGLESYQPERESSILRRLLEISAEFELDGELIRKIWQAIFVSNRGER